MVVLASTEKLSLLNDVQHKFADVQRNSTICYVEEVFSRSTRQQRNRHQEINIVIQSTPDNSNL